jgi:hypothetical protein
MKTPIVSRIRRRIATLICPELAQEVWRLEATVMDLVNREEILEERKVKEAEERIEELLSIIF